MGLLSGKKKSAAAKGGQPFEIWGQRGWHNVDAVGESYHGAAIRALLPKGHDDQGTEAIVPVSLVHNPNNRHDPNAVEIQATTGLIGHLSREDASRYAPVLATLQQAGRSAITTARVYGYDRKDWDTGKREFVGSVRVDLPEPHMLLPANEPPTEPHSILPAGSAMQVTGEENHMEALARYLNANGQCWVHATLHEVKEASARTVKELVEVRIDGNAIGRLTPKMSSELLPAVRFLSDQGNTTCVRAIVKGNQLKAEVVLFTVRAHELPSDWVAAISAADARQSQTPSGDDGAAVTSDDDTGATQGSVDETAAPPLPPADWYPDPHKVARLRYWDGRQWTTHTAP